MSTKPSEMLTVIEPDSKEFRKANNAVSVRVKSGPTLSLLGRRLFNVLLYQAQTLGTPGVNAPPPWGACPNPQDYYWMPLPDVVQDPRGAVKTTNWSSRRCSSCKPHSWNPTILREGLHRYNSLDRFTW